MMIWQHVIKGKWEYTLLDFYEKSGLIIIKAIFNFNYLLKKCKNKYYINKYINKYKKVKNKKIVARELCKLRIRILSISLWNGEAPVHGEDFPWRASMVKNVPRHLKPKPHT